MIGSWKELTVGGHRAIRHVLTGTSELTNLVYIQTTVECERGFHQILGWTLASRAGTARKVIETAVATFRELDEPGGDTGD
jgi:hypothetical protein